MCGPERENDRQSSEKRGSESRTPHWKHRGHEAPPQKFRTENPDKAKCVHLRLSGFVEILYSIPRNVEKIGIIKGGYIMDALLDKYETKFGECFPLMLCRHMTDTEICEMVQQCLDSNEPYNPELDPDADY